MRKLTMPELKRLSVVEFKKAAKCPVVVVLDNIRSQNNVGSVFRTADAFRLQGICLCGITSTPPHREIHKTALGATESVDWHYYKNTVDAITWLRSEGYTILALEQTDSGIALHEMHPEPGQKLAIVFGNEVHGINDSVLKTVDRCIEIPQFGTKHSLNVSVSVGIVIWDLFTKIKNFSTDATLS